jgi:hypothetical protein
MDETTHSWFCDSQWVVGVQMADLCAYSVRKYLSSRFTQASTEASNPERLFEQIERLLWCPKHESTNPECDCRICSLLRDDDVA